MAAFAPQLRRSKRSSTVPQTELFISAAALLSVLWKTWNGGSWRNNVERFARLPDATGECYLKAESREFVSQMSDLENSGDIRRRHSSGVSFSWTHTLCFNFFIIKFTPCNCYCTNICPLNDRGSEEATQAWIGIFCTLEFSQMFYEVPCFTKQKFPNRGAILSLAVVSQIFFILHATKNPVSCRARNKNILFCNHKQLFIQYRVINNYPKLKDRNRFSKRFLKVFF